MDKVSVIIPVKNRPETIGRAINSARAQSGVLTEIIVVDDGSDDATNELLRTTGGITLLRNEKSRGGAAARNQGVDASTAGLVAFLDSDDEWLPQHLDTSIRFMNETNAAGVFSEFFLVNDNGKTEIRFDKPPRSISIGEAILSNYRFDARTSTFLFRKEYFNRVRFDDELLKHQDWDLAIRFDESYKLVLKRQPTVLLHTGTQGNRMSASFNHEASMRFIAKMRDVVRQKYIFDFCLKQVYRIDRAGLSSPYRARYLGEMKAKVGVLGIRRSILYLIVRLGLVDISVLKRIKNALKRW